MGEFRVSFGLTGVGLAGALILLSSVLAPLSAGAQLVRGVVRESGSGRPLAGVVVSLEEGRPEGATDTPSLARAVLSDANGAYALQVAAAGRYAISAKRIGVQRFTSPAFDLAVGETKELAITLEPLRYELPRVAITSASPCATRADQRERVAALWEEARTSLTASQLSLRDRLFRANITQFERELAPRTLSIRDERRVERESVTEHAFVSVPAESLAVHGYARSHDDGTYDVYAPDERVLLSDLFVRDHCFSLARPRRDSLVGIAFEPARRGGRGRRPIDIRGTVMLDARTFELRYLAYQYTSLPIPISDTLAGGEVHFSRLPSGAWFVSHWFIRTPMVEGRTETVAVPSARSRVATLIPVVTGYRVQGGTVLPLVPGATTARSVLTGRIVDSTGSRGLEGATVLVAGTSRTARAGRDGGFRLDSLPAGEHTLLVEHPTYSALGMRAAEQVLTLNGTQPAMTLVQAIGSEQILRRLCDYSEHPVGTVALRFVLSDSVSDAALANREMEVSWDERRTMGPGIVRTVTRSTDIRTDAGGAANVCGLPSEAIVRVMLGAEDGDQGRTWKLFAPKEGIVVVGLRH